MPSGKQISSGASGDSTDGWASVPVVPLPLLAEGVGAVRRQVRERVGRLPAVAVLEVNVRPGRVAGRTFVPDQLPLVDSVAGLHLEAEQVAVERKEVVAVREDDVVSIADQLAVAHA